MTLKCTHCHSILNTTMPDAQTCKCGKLRYKGYLDEEGYPAIHIQGSYDTVKKGVSGGESDK